MVTSESHTERPAAFRFPKGACDVHCHVFGPAAKFPFAKGGPYQPADSSKQALVALHRLMGIDRMVIVHPAAHGTDHEVTLDAIRDDPENRRGVGIVNATFTSAQLQQLHKGGFRGARFSFLNHLGGGPDAETFARVVDLIAPLGWHLVLHVTGDDLLANERRFNELPISFVIDHMARVDAALGVNQSAMQALLDLARNPKCWIKVSGASRVSPPPFDAAVPIAQAILAATPDRCLWGTDFPHPNAKYHAENADLVDLIPKYTVDPAVQERLLVTNPMQLYGFSKPA